MNENKEFKPYIPADKITPEFTVTSIIMGVILAVIFGAANAYLGLRVGMTVSASIPAAVISMGVIRVIMKKDSILESNMVQTIGSAGESLAAGAIFTMPALFLWAEEGLCEMPGIVEITLIALCGGVLGVLFMVPLRNALIVKEHATLLYPEGTACADVLLAGEEGGANAATVFSGMGIAAIFKFVVDGLKVIPADVAVAFKGFKGEIGMECYPALLGVGYIVGPRIASFMFVGSLIGWMVLIPVICLFGADTVMYPGTETISALYAAGGASKIWSTYVKYIGAGAIATGGIISLIKSLPLIIATFRDSMKSMKGGSASGTSRTEKDLPMPFILGGILLIILIIWLAPAIPVSPLGALLIVIFGFFFSTVSARMVGMIGSSNNPVSGMTIATLLIATMILKATGNVGIEGMIGSMAIASVICICAAIAADTSQDLKTGYLLGATPVKQQIGELIAFLKSIKPDIICMVDNCYGEFVEMREPSDLGADMIVGSLIKNPGGGLAPIGGYICGTRECVDRCAYRLSAPGLGQEVGANLGLMPAFYQGLFLSPTVVASAVKSAVFAAACYEKLGFRVVPGSAESRHDIIQAVELGSKEAMVAFCKGIQSAAAVDSYVTPEPWAMPGYESEVIMAAGAFVQGSSIELSADGPIRPPYAVYFQGGLTWFHGKLGILLSMQKLADAGIIKL